MTAIELPDDFDPGAGTAGLFAAARASVQAEMDRVGDWNGFLRLHGVSESMIALPEIPWDATGRVRQAGSYAPPVPGTGPTNGGLAASLQGRR